MECCTVRKEGERLRQRVRRVSGGRGVMRRQRMERYIRSSISSVMLTGLL